MLADQGKNQNRAQAFQGQVKTKSTRCCILSSDCHIFTLLDDGAMLKLVSLRFTDSIVF